jgi:AraC-like DNA-binding protein
MAKGELEIDAVRKRFILIYAIFLAFVELTTMVFTWSLDEPQLKYMGSVSFILQIFVIIVSLYFSFPALKPIIPIYILVFGFFFFIRLAFLLQSNISAPYMWLIVAPISVYVVSPDKTMGWCIYFFVLGVLAFFMKDILVSLHIIWGDFPSRNTEATTESITFARVYNFVAVFIHLCIAIYYIQKVRVMEIQILESKLEHYKKKEQKLNIIENNDEKYSELYENLLHYFETQKPYMNPDLEITQVAIALETNIVYLSKAIKINRDMNFSTFVNIYRINKVKEMIKGNQSKFTLEYIYVSSGFRNQSTFNKVFKLIEGMTPSEYYRKHTK